MKLSDRLRLIQSDITSLEVDAIANAANPGLLGGGGVDGAIHRAAGPELLQACRELGGCPTGEARLTPGFGLKTRYVIHTVGPVYRGVPGDADLLAACIRNTLALARENNCKSLALPAISTGVYGYPKAEAARVMLGEARLQLKQHPLPETITFCLFSDTDFKLWSKIFKELMHGS